MSDIFSIIEINNGKEKNEQFYCSLCNFPLFDNKDFNYNSEFGCCNECYLIYAQPRIKEWISGWRPSKDLINKNILQRKRLYSKKFKL